MPNISLLKFARLLGSNSVSGMAQKVGFPFRPISVRNLVKLAGTALVLSGGGAKGSFEVGALQYLYSNGFRPGIICSTSVGSVNGLKLAEGEGDGSDPNRGFQGLKQIWLNEMTFDTDMFVEDSWVQTSAQWIRDILNKNLSLFSIPELLPTLAFHFFPEMLVDIGLRIDEFADFVGSALKAKGIYNLQPIQDKARKHLNVQFLGSIKLRMAAVGLQSGAVKYVSERGRLLADPSLPSDDPKSPQVEIIQGMVASASIPVFFEAQNLAGDWYVDGGIRQVVPLRAAIEMGATEVYVIVAPIPLTPDSDYTRKGLLDIAMRAATDITIDEITNDNITSSANPFSSTVDSSETPVHIIRPSVEVESSRTIDPGLIRINIAYGFMRAYDVLSQQSDSAVALTLLNLSDLIASTRTQIWNRENDIANLAINVATALASSAPPNPPDFVNELQNKFADLRHLKNVLMGAVNCRFNLTGIASGSMPTDSDPTTWGTSWEAHQWDPTNIQYPFYTFGNPVPQYGYFSFPANPWNRIFFFTFEIILTGIPQPMPPPFTNCQPG